MDTKVTKKTESTIAKKTEDTKITKKTGDKKTDTKTMKVTKTDTVKKDPGTQIHSVLTKEYLVQISKKYSS